MLMAGENPGHSIAMVGGDKLYGKQLNDGYTRLAAEDGLMFGSIRPSIALEVLYQLRQINFKGHYSSDAIQPFCHRSIIIVTYVGVLYV